VLSFLMCQLEDKLLDKYFGHDACVLIARNIGLFWNTQHGGDICQNKKEACCHGQSVFRSEIGRKSVFVKRNQERWEENKIAKHGNSQCHRCK